MTNYNRETKKRLQLINKIKTFVECSQLTGFLVTGSIAWGKEYAVNKQSDIDFYFLANKLNDYIHSLKQIDFFPKKSIRTIEELLTYQNTSIDTRSLKTQIGNYHGAVYFFTENKIEKLIRRMKSEKSKFFTNLRPHEFPQHKFYKSPNGNKIDFETPIRKAPNAKNLFIRRDPLLLLDNKEFYGSIFISHILFGDIYVDKNHVFNDGRIKTAKLVSKFFNESSNSYEKFINYLPRAQRMRKKTKKKLFNLVLNS